MENEERGFVILLGLYHFLCGFLLGLTVRVMERDFFSGSRYKLQAVAANSYDQWSNLQSLQDVGIPVQMRLWEGSV